MVIKNRNGWTLVELMIVAAITGILASITPTIITQTTKFFILSKTKLELQEQARAIMYILTRELRQAQSNSITIDGALNQPYYSRIVFTKIGGTQIMKFAQSGTNLILTTISNNHTDNNTLTKNLVYLAFTFPKSDDMTIVSVSLTLQEQIYNGQLKAMHMASEKVRVMN